MVIETHNRKVEGNIAAAISGLVRNLRREETAGPDELTLGKHRNAENKPSVTKAIKIAKNQNFKNLVGKFKRNFHAVSARASRNCKRAEVLRLAKEVSGDGPVLPLSRDVVEGVATALKEAGMKSGNQCLTAETAPRGGRP